MSGRKVEGSVALGKHRPGQHGICVGYLMLHADRTSCKYAVLRNTVCLISPHIFIQLEPTDSRQEYVSGCWPTSSVFCKILTEIRAG